MATISKTGITDGLTSKAEHITRIIDALDGTATTQVVATGSFTGSFTGDGSALTGVASGIFTPTGSYYATTNDLQITGSIVVTGTVDLTTSSGLLQRLVTLSNTSATTVSLASYDTGTTFEIDLSQSTTNDIILNLGDCPSTTARLNYWITFSTVAADLGATFQLNNDGSTRAYSLETNDNTGVFINGSGGTATTAITELRYTTVQIVNRKNPGGNSYWYIEFRSDSATAFTIA